MKRKAIPEPFSYPSGPLGSVLRLVVSPQELARAERAARAARAAGPAEWKPVGDRGSQPSRRGLTLEPDVSDQLSQTSLTGFALQWNGFIGLFIVMGFLVDGDAMRDMMLFLIPFILAGLGMIGWIVYQAMARTHAGYVRLSLEEAQPTLGTVCRLRWRLDGLKSRIQKLTIAVEGREVATYSRGTNMVTDHETFFRWVLFDDRPREGQGIVTVSIPEFTMPSLKARWNAIEWLVTVHGEIPWWWDVKGEFPFTVHVPNRGPR